MESLDQRGWHVELMIEGAGEVLDSPIGPRLKRWGGKKTSLHCAFSPHTVVHSFLHVLSVMTQNGRTI